MSDLTSAQLTGANLHRADFFKAQLTEADLTRADLTEAKFFTANLMDAEFFDANLSGVVFEPKTNPAAYLIAYARGLDHLAFSVDSAALIMLRKNFFDGGFNDQGKLVNAAFHRHDQGIPQALLFDWTCEWGVSWLRPLGLVGLMSLLCTAIYWVGLHFEQKGGLRLVAGTTRKGKERMLRIRIRLSQVSPHTTQAKRVLQRMRREIRGLGTAFLFSLLSAFNLGFQSFNLGQWMRMLQPREFDIRAQGWIRTVAGIQSLLGLMLLVLSVLSYFGHPAFD